MQHVVTHGVVQYPRDTGGNLPYILHYGIDFDIGDSYHWNLTLTPTPILTLILIPTLTLTLTLTPILTPILTLTPALTLTLALALTLTRRQLQLEQDGLQEARHLKVPGPLLRRAAQAAHPA